MSIELYRIEGLLNTAISAAITGVDLVFENSADGNGNSYTSTVGTPFIETFIIPGPPETIEIGTCGRDRYIGVYQVNFNYPVASGKYAMYQKLKTMMDTIRRGAVFTDGTLTVRIRSVYPSTGYLGQGDQAGFYTTPVSIAYDCDVAVNV